VCSVLRVLPCGEGGQRGRCCEQEVAAQAVVGVHCVGGLEGDLLLSRRRGHGEVGAGRLNDIHGVRLYVCELISKVIKFCVFVLCVGVGAAGSGA
jgi:hypothetical protein